MNIFCRILVIKLLVNVMNFILSEYRSILTRLSLENISIHD